MKKTTLFILSLLFSYVSFGIGPITGVASLCSGSSETLSDTATGGTWSSSNITVASIISGTGYLTGVSAGTAVISYYLSGALATATVTINPSPVAITGASAICPGTTLILIDPSFGGHWSSASVGVATIGSSSGVVTAVSAGTTSITYTLAGGCFASTEVTVNAAPAAIWGTLGFCSFTTLSDATSGGTWSSSNTTIAVVGSTSGVVAGLIWGTAIITYMTSCPATVTVTFYRTPAAISGLSSVCQGNIITLTDGVTGGTWSSNNTSVATIGSGTGILSGVSSGTTSITYTLAGGCSAITVVTVNPIPSPITGITTICLGYTTTLSDLVMGGTWSSSSTADAPVGLTTGVVSGVAVGLGNITYTLPTGCYNTIAVTVYPNPAPITGTPEMCAGSTTTFYDVTTGGEVFSSDYFVASLSGAGLVTGVSAGVAVITYELSTGCFTTTIVTVNPTPSVISGLASVCHGYSVTLTDSVSGGTWTSGNISVGTIGASSGVFSDISTGTTIITYLLPGGCFATRVETVLSSPAPITGASGLCELSTTTLSDATSGGYWSSTLVTMGSTGVATAIDPGIAMVTYTIGTGCSSTKTLTVYPIPSPITGGTGMCVATSLSLYDTIAGGTWTSSNTAVAVIGALSGSVVGLSVGTTIITYSTFTGCFVTQTLTVFPTPTPIVFPANICSGSCYTLTAAVSGGTWASANTAILTIGSSSGIACGVSIGTTVVTYSLGAGCSALTLITVTGSPAPVTGSSSLCVGYGGGESDVTPGGTWSSSNTTVVPIGATTGIIEGLSAGTSIITYSLGTGCMELKTVTVNPSPSNPSGPHAICIGATVTLGDIIGGGTWVSGATSVATIGLSTGLVTGLSLGTTIITYTVASGCFITDTITVSPSPTAISGSSSLCIGSPAIYSDGVSGGLWSSSNSAVVTIGSITGVVTGVSAGTARITYFLGTGCMVLKTLTVVPSLPGIAGPSALCVAATLTLSDATTGGTWASSSTGIATVGSSSGIVTGVFLGTTTITYSIGTGCYTTEIINVSDADGPIEPGSACAGTTTDMTAGVTGGLWQSSNASVALIGSLTGILSGVSAGTTIITYSLGTGCSAYRTFMVLAAPAAITGVPSLCAGGVTDLGDISPGGLWSSSNTAVATAGSATGYVTGVSAGTAIISYVIGSGCPAIFSVTVNPSPAAIEGPSAICAGTTAILNDSVGGGTWTSSNFSVSIGTVTGVANGITIGTSIITYALSDGCFKTTTLAVTPLPTVISGLSSVCAGASVTWSDGISGGTWVSGNIVVATVGSLSGTITGVSAGTSLITYWVGPGCGVISEISVITGVASITGSGGFCMLSSAALNDSTSGGYWVSSNISVAIVGSATGILFGVAPGTATITYSAGGSCTATRIETVYPLPDTITGDTALCLGMSDTLSDAATGGIWSTGSTAVAAVGSGTGVVTGVAAGTGIITYSLGAGCTVTDIVTVHPSPSSISGASHFCTGSTAALSDTTTGGVWSSGATAIATIGTSGVATGVSAGTATVYYTLSTGCATSFIETIDPVPSGIAGSTLVCGSDTLTDGTSGGAWSSSNTSVAMVGSGSGIITGVMAGTAIMTYTLPAGCSVTKAITVNFLPAPGAISGITHQCQGDSATLTDVTTGGAWSSSNAAVATVNSVTGAVTGTGIGLDAISYTLTNVCGATTVSVMDTVYGLPVVDSVLGGDSVCAGDTIIVTDSIISGVWSSSDTTIALVDSTGMIIGVAAGTANISFTVTTICGSATAIMALTVNPLSSCNTGVKPVTGTNSADISIEPNPNKGSFFLKGSLGNSIEDVTVEITDMPGREVYAQAIHAPGGNLNEQVTLAHGLVDGVYLLHLYSSTVNRVFQIVVEQ